MSATHLDWSAPVLLVADLERALGFYGERLGFTVEFVYQEFYASVERDGCLIHLKQAPPAVRDQAAFEEQGHVDVCFGVPDAAALAAEFTGSSAEFAVPLREMPYGHEFYLRDPDGYVLAFVEAVIGED